MRVQRETGLLVGSNPFQANKQESHRTFSEIFIPEMETVKGEESSGEESLCT